MVYRLLYVSEFNGELTSDDIQRILTTARAQNAEVDITGLLLQLGQAFMQVLEGPQAAVENTFNIIQADRRHHRVRVLLAHPVEERHFPTWSMGFELVARTEETDGLFRLTSDALQDVMSPDVRRQLSSALTRFLDLSQATAIS